MRLPWLSREYLRTCADCGYTWRVPRPAARRRIGVISMFTIAPRGGQVDRPELARQVQAISAQNAPAAAYRRCPRCGADDFTQHRAGSRGPVTDPGFHQP